MKMLMSLVCFLLLACSLSLQVQASERESSSKRSSPVNKPDVMVCKKIALTGTRIRRKVCRRQSFWRNLEEESQRAARDLEMRGQRTRGNVSIFD